MCGVAAAIGVAEAGAVAETMARAMSHRGPDDHGHSTLVDGDGVVAGAMAHRRLAIIDLTANGHQPMATRDGRFAIAFNGEIYNYRELDARLARHGHGAPRGGDTAVLLEAWARYGPRVLEDAAGMFAFALWDAQERALYVARDPFGIKPLYYARVDGGVLVASELRALLASGRVAPRLEPRAVASYLTFGAVQEPATIIAGVRMVPAGAVLRFVVGDRAVREERVATVAPFAMAVELLTDRRTAVRELRRALERSIDRHLVSDVPVSVFLSGGLDSSAVAALAAQRAGAAIDGFTVTFAERRFDERGIARQVADRYGINHHEIPLGGRDLLAALPAAFAAMDQPTLDGINTYVVSEAVRARGSKVVLSGLGGDE
ncbi:MAG TPA: asparagine synthase (glutamine-hydrolyzing), partial [Gemmatimonadaceae bacterium]|nr:asparagine synthase (glutamine-hydrolyzing) [Gemmatimonadaceae bacterium]